MDLFVAGAQPIPPAGPLIWTDGKALDALRTIGEVGQALGIRQHVLRYWEEQFPMLSPLKRSGGRRYYRPADVALVRRIDQLVHHEGYTLRGARLVLESGDHLAEQTEPPVAREPADVPAPGLSPRAAFEALGRDVRPQLRAIRDRLAAALQG